MRAFMLFTGISVLAGSFLFSPDAVSPETQVRTLEKQHKFSEALHLVEKHLALTSPTDIAYSKLCDAKARILRAQADGDTAYRFLVSQEKGTSPINLYHLKVREGEILESQAKHEDADQALQDAIEALGPGGDPKLLANTNISRIWSLKELGDFAKAEKCLESAERYVSVTQDHTLDPYIWNYRAILLSSQNRFEEAIPYAEHSREAFQKRKQNEKAANATITLASAYLRLGRQERALELYRQADQMYSANQKYLSTGHIGAVYYEQENFPEAAKFFEQAAHLAIGIDETYRARWLANLSTTYLDLDNVNVAVDANQKALQVKSSAADIKAQTCINSARIAAKQQRLKEAERLLQTMEQSPKTPKFAVLDAYTALGNIYSTQNRSAAKQQFEAALQLVGSTRESLRDDENKLQYLDSLIKLHRNYVKFLMGEKEWKQAFRVTESSRARVLRDRLELKKPFTSNYSIADYQQAAAESGSVYLAYWVSPQKSYLWAISGNHSEAFELPGKAEIGGLLERYQNGVLSTKSSEGAGAKLFEILIPKALRHKNRFVIVPDGPLYGFNFETLLTGTNPRRYWIEVATVAVAPCLELLLREPSAKPMERSLLAIGDADEWKPEFPKLESAANEIDRVQRAFGVQQPTLLTKANATAANFQKANPARFSHIQISAHATADQNAPLNSSIILSNGVLSAREILKTKVNADLVTISACSSVGAKNYAGEGLVGLVWAFLQSGAHSVIAGLWEVNDYSSPQIMEGLYKGLAQGQRPADALRSAKLKLLEPGSKYADPSYWGPFQLYLGTRQDSQRRIASNRRVNWRAAQ